MNSTIFLRLLVSRILNWKFQERLAPQTGSLPYWPGLALTGPLYHALNEIGSTTLNTILLVPHTLLIEGSSSIYTANPSAWLNAVGNTPLLTKMLCPLLPKLYCRVVESSFICSRLLFKFWKICD